MNDVLRHYLDAFPAHQKMNGLRKYFQRLIVAAIDDAGYRKKIVFTGGTALHLVYGTRRYSEDMDFSLADSKGYETQTMARKLFDHMSRRGLQAELYQLK